MSRPLTALVFAVEVSPTRQFPAKRLGFQGVWPDGPLGSAKGAPKRVGCEFVDLHARDYSGAGASHVESAPLPDAENVVEAGKLTVTFFLPDVWRTFCRTFAAI
jgi:hypothetical protein